MNVRVLLSGDFPCVSLDIDDSNFIFLLIAYLLLSYISGKDVTFRCELRLTGSKLENVWEINLQNSFSRK